MLNDRLTEFDTSTQVLSWCSCWSSTVRWASSHRWSWVLPVTGCHPPSPAPPAARNTPTRLTPNEETCKDYTDTSCSVCLHSLCPLLSTSVTLQVGKYYLRSKRIWPGLFPSIWPANFTSSNTDCKSSLNHLPTRCLPPSLLQSPAHLLALSTPTSVTHPPTASFHPPTASLLPPTASLHVYISMVRSLYSYRYPLTRTDTQKMAYLSLQVPLSFCSSCQSTEACVCDTELYDTYHCEYGTVITPIWVEVNLCSLSCTAVGLWDSDCLCSRDQQVRCDFEMADSLFTHNALFIGKTLRSPECLLTLSAAGRLLLIFPMLQQNCRYCVSKTVGTVWVKLSVLCE